MARLPPAPGLGPPARWRRCVVAGRYGQADGERSEDLRRKISRAIEEIVAPYGLRPEETAAE